MPLDTSIPLQFNQAAPAQAINPMTIYQAMQDQRVNALREQMYQQEMAKNAMIMQNTMEDRRLAAATRTQAAAQAAEERRRLAEYRGVVGQFGTTDAAVGRRGVGYSGTGVSNDPYAFVRNQLVRGGFVPQAEELAKVQKEQLASEESMAKIPGLKAVSSKQQTEAADTQLAQIASGIDRAPTLEAVYALYKANPDALAVRGQTPDTAITMFNQHVAELTKTLGDPAAAFDRARMDVAKGVMDTQKHISDMLTADTTRNKPIEMDLGGKKILVDPNTLQPAAEFAKTMTPDEANKSGKTKDAKASLDETLSRLGEEYSALDAMGAAPSEKQSTLENIGRRFPSSYIGQAVGYNPEVQTRIQTIEGLRNDVILAIKAASGMSAKEMDSNAELQRQLAGATSPGQNIESVRRRLTDISKKYGAGKDFTKTEEKSTKVAPANVPATNDKGWKLHTDADGNRAYVSPDGKQFEEVK